jgi:hypothetical protein
VPDVRGESAFMTRSSRGPSNHEQTTPSMALHVLPRRQRCCWSELWRLSKA